jgi:hypothetical protein
LQQSFEADFPDNHKEPNTYARELLEYCCHKALHAVTTRPDYLADKNLRCLMFDMMLAWEHPGAEDGLLENVRHLIAAVGHEIPFFFFPLSNCRLLTKLKVNAPHTHISCREISA